MAKYVHFFSYAADTWSALVNNPSDRVAAARAALEAAGGSLESMYFMFGSRDGFVIFEAPDAEAAAAVAIAAAASGRFASAETHELIEPERLAAVLSKAGDVAGALPSTGNVIADASALRAAVGRIRGV